MKILTGIRIMAVLIAIIFLFSACGTKKVSEPSKNTLKQGESSSMSNQSNATSSVVTANSLKNTSVSTSSSSKNQVTTSTVPQKVVTMNISDFETYGNDLTDISEAIKTLNIRSSASKIKGENVLYKLTLKNKIYKFSATLVINGGSNIEINGNGASFIWTQTILGINMTGCSNFAFSNLTMDYDPLVFTQGIVTKIDGNKVNVKIDDGYRADLAFLNNKSGNDGNLWSNIHDKSTGAVLDGTPHSYAFQNAVDMGNRVIQVTKVFGEENSGRALSVNDHISLFQRGPGTIATSNCEVTKLTNVNIYSSPGFALNEGSGNGGSILTNLKIIPGPKPTGATTIRVRSSNGDATHFGNQKNGPIFDSCTITHCGDDGINIQGFFFHVLQVNGTKLIVSPKWSTPLTVGETIEGYKDIGYTSTGTAKITSFAVMNDAKWTAQINAAYANYDKAIGDNTLVYEIILDKAIGLVKGDHITSIDRIGSGAVIKNSTFKYNRARGIVVKGRNILIENNTFDRNTHPAIVAAADILWCESGFPVNIIIRGNKISRSATSSNMILDGRVDQIGAILISLAPPSNITGFYKSMQNKNILIEGNTITDSQVYGIFAINCDGLTIKNNTITHPFINGIGKVGQLYGIKPKSAIFVGMSKNVSVSGNKITSGGTISQAVEIYSNCTNILANTNNTFK